MDEFTGSVQSGNPAGEMLAGNAGAPVAPSQPSQPDSWYGGFPEEIRGFVENKGWKDPADAITSYINMEKYLGADKAGRGVVLPKQDAAPEEWNSLYDRLGRPKSPDEYGIQPPPGDTGEFAKEASEMFHKAGLTAQQAQQLATWYQEKSGMMLELQQSQMMQNSEAEISQLQQEWGKDYDANLEAGRRAARQFGVNQEMLQKVENAIGTKEMLKFFAQIGKSMGEDNFVEGKPSGSFGMSPEAARVRITQLKQDPDWTAKYLSGNADAKAELERLMRVGYPS